MLRRLRRWLRIGSLDRGDFADASNRPAENVDDMAAAWHGEQEKTGHDLGGDANAPPGYVKAYDEGRPRH
jgi:hypothetical protein